MSEVDELLTAVAEATTTTEDGEHLVVRMDYINLIRSSEGLVPVQRASGYLATGEWSHVVSTCGIEDCCRLDHLEEQGLALVTQHHQAVTLADLYRKARSRGLVTARTEYGG